MKKKPITPLEAHVKCCPYKQESYPQIVEIELKNNRGYYCNRTDKCNRKCGYVNKFLNNIL